MDHAIIFIRFRDLFYLILFLKMVRKMAYYQLDTELIGVKIDQESFLFFESLLRDKIG